MTDLVFKAQSYIFFPFIILASQINLGNPKYSILYLQTYYMIHIQTTTDNPISISDTIPPTVRSINDSISLANYAIRSQLFTSCNKSRATTMILILMIPNHSHTR